ncbi:hypothetical protein ACJX0J_039971 [Zea mays]
MCARHLVGMLEYKYIYCCHIKKLYLNVWARDDNSEEEEQQRKPIEELLKEEITSNLRATQSLLKKCCRQIHTSHIQILQDDSREKNELPRKTFSSVSYLFKLLIVPTQTALIPGQNIMEGIGANFQTYKGLRQGDPNKENIYLSLFGCKKGVYALKKLTNNDWKMFDSVHDVFFRGPKGSPRKIDYFRSQFFWQGNDHKNKYRLDSD